MTNSSNDMTGNKMGVGIVIWVALGAAFGVVLGAVWSHRSKLEKR